MLPLGNYYSGGEEDLRCAGVAREVRTEDTHQPCLMRATGQMSERCDVKSMSCSLTVDYYS